MTFASYEKEIENKIIRIRHIVRPRLNETKRQILQALEHVPDDAVLSAVVGDDEYELYGELYFDEEKDF